MCVVSSGLRICQSMSYIQAAGCARWARGGFVYLGTVVRPSVQALQCDFVQYPVAAAYLQTHVLNDSLTKRLAVRPVLVVLVLRLYVGKIDCADLYDKQAMLHLIKKATKQAEAFVCERIY